MQMPDKADSNRPQPIWSIAGQLAVRFEIPPARWAALPMNSQAFRTELARRVILECRISRIVETGTYLGTTTEFFARFGVPVTTAEVDPDLVRKSNARLGKWKNVEVRAGHSIRMLQDLANEAIDRNAPTFFYLDAHWGDQLPLREEAELAITHFPKSVLLIDDFAVPDDPGYGFDDYGPGKQLTLEYLLQSNLPPLALYFPSTPSHKETGARRGCVVATANPDIAAILDEIPLLRRWKS
jgi:hypothetical protein